jgi:hypothetical protein
MTRTLTLVHNCFPAAAFLIPEVLVHLPSYAHKRALIGICHAGPTLHCSDYKPLIESIMCTRTQQLQVGHMSNTTRRSLAALQ